MFASTLRREAKFRVKVDLAYIVASSYVTAIVAILQTVL